MWSLIRIPSAKVKTFYSESTKSSLRAIVGNFESEEKYLITKSDTGVIQTIKNDKILMFKNIQFIAILKNN